MLSQIELLEDEINDLKSLRATEKSKAKALQDQLKESSQLINHLMTGSKGSDGQVTAFHQEINSVKPEIEILEAQMGELEIQVSNERLKSEAREKKIQRSSQDSTQLMTNPRT